MAHIKTFEDFKNNMVLVDKGIAENSTVTVMFGNIFSDRFLFCCLWTLI